MEERELEKQELGPKDVTAPASLEGPGQQRGLQILGEAFWAKEGRYVDFTLAHGSWDGLEEVERNSVVYRVGRTT